MELLYSFSITKRTNDDAMNLRDNIAFYAKPLYDVHSVNSNEQTGYDITLGGATLHKIIINTAMLKFLIKLKGIMKNL
jgi:hypothetical protein